MSIDPKNTEEVIVTQSAIFGQISIPAEQCLTFERGLLGFSCARRFAILPAAPDGVFWLQDVDDGSLTFLVIDPHDFVPDYSFDTDNIEGPAPTIADESNCAVLCIVTLPHESGEAATANLQGPVFVDFSSRKGWQLVMGTPDFGTRHPIDLSLPTNNESSSSDTTHR